MKQDKQFDNILNECLDRVLRGETIEKCLQIYPGKARELEPLLRTALAAKQAVYIQPRAEFKAQARYAFNSALREMQDKKAHRWSFFKPTFVWQTGWVVAIVIILVVVISGGSTMVMASNSMPDNPLYPVKLAAEQAQLVITPSDIGKAELNARFADRRADEITYLANKGDAREVQIAAQRMNSNLENMTNLAKSSNKDNKGNSNTTFNTDNGASNKSGNTAAGNAPQPLLAPPAAAPNAVPTPARTAVPSNVPAPAVSLAPRTQPSTPVVAAPVPAGAPAAPAVKAAPPATEGAVSGAGSQGFSKNGPPSAAATTPARNAEDNSARSNADNSPNNGRNSQNSKAKEADQAKIKQIIIDNFNKRQDRLNEALNKASSDVRPALRQALSKSQDEFDKALKNLDRNDDEDN